MVDNLADNFGSPALGEQRNFAIFEAAEVEPVGNQIAHVLSRAGEAGSDLSAATNAAESCAEKLAEQIELWARAFALEARQLVLFQREGALHALGKTRQKTLYIAALHAADSADPLGIRRLALGQLDEQVVAENSAGRLITALSFGIAPVRKL